MEIPYDNSDIWDDATWILTSAFIIFTMQTGFGMLEAGAVSPKNEANIMTKNCIDVIAGGLTYWLVGYSLSFGDGPGTNSFCGVGTYAVDGNENELGMLFTSFTFQLSFATTATTIVSGAMAGRTKLSAYVIFSALNTIVYAIPCHWVWSETGFLSKMGALDFAGSGVVHMSGGMSGLCGAMILGPRLGRYKSKSRDQEKERPAEENAFQLGDPVNSVVGLFVLWWAWIGFNCGSTFGISGQKWQIASKASITTLLGSFSAGVVGMVISWWRNDRRIFDVSDMVNSILGGLVAITANCSMVEPWEACVIGAIGGIICIYCPVLMDAFEIDDPVSAVAVHGVCGIWGLLAVGIFAADPAMPQMEWVTRGQNGLLHGGGFYLLGVQTLTALSICSWSFITTFFTMWPIQQMIGFRMSAEEEVLGADFVEHGIRMSGVFDRTLLHVMENPEELRDSNRLKLERYFRELAETRLRDQKQMVKLHRLLELPVMAQLYSHSVSQKNVQGESSL